MLDLFHCQASMRVKFLGSICTFFSESQHTTGVLMLLQKLVTGSARDRAARRAQHGFLTAAWSLLPVSPVSSVVDSCFFALNVYL